MTREEKIKLIAVALAPIFDSIDAGYLAVKELQEIASRLLILQIQDKPEAACVGSIAVPDYSHSKSGGLPNPNVYSASTCVVNAALDAIVSSQRNDSARIHAEAHKYALVLAAISVYGLVPTHVSHYYLREFIARSGMINVNVVPKSWLQQGRSSSLSHGAVGRLPFDVTASNCEDIMLQLTSSYAIDVVTTTQVKALYRNDTTKRGKNTYTYVYQNGYCAFTHAGEVTWNLDSCGVFNLPLDRSDWNYLPQMHEQIEKYVSSKRVTMHLEETQQHLHNAKVVKLDNILTEAKLYTEFSLENDGSCPNNVWLCYVGNQPVSVIRSLLEYIGNQVYDSYEVPFSFTAGVNPLVNGKLALVTKQGLTATVRANTLTLTISDAKINDYIGVIQRRVSP